jgi:protein tyrosine/serine phosphatase
MRPALLWPRGTLSKQSVFTLVFNSFRTDEQRYARRMARIARWNSPVSGRLDRAGAWANMIFNDHGIFRLAYLNSHKVSDELWRSAQPTPHDIARFAAKGVKTIINLRGGREHGGWKLAVEACEKHGIAYVDFILRSRGAPDRAQILAAPAFFDSVHWPALVHCKSGADRAGFFSALYVLIRQNRPVAEAQAQLSMRYGHFRFAKTGILDAFLDTYAREGASRGVRFLDWVATDYDPEKLEADFRTGFWSSLIADRLIRRE